MVSWRTRAASAVRFKQNEREVFRQLLRQASSELPRTLLRDLAELGRSHVSRLKAMAERAVIEMDEEAAHALRELTERAEAVGDEMGAVRLGLELKRQSCELYEGLAEVADNAFERHFYQQLAAEERDCLLALLNCQEYLSDPPAYFNHTEHVSLDG